MCRLCAWVHGWMSYSEGAAPTAFDRLIAACWRQDLPAAQAAVAEGASVHRRPGGDPSWELGPLTCAVGARADDVVNWLLARGAVPDDTGELMYFASFYSEPAVLQRLVDVGANVNRASWGKSSLHWAVDAGSARNVRVLLDTPWLDLCSSAEEDARAKDCPLLADIIHAEKARRNRLTANEAAREVYVVQLAAVGRLQEVGLLQSTAHKRCLEGLRFSWISAAILFT